MKTCLFFYFIKFFQNFYFPYKGTGIEIGTGNPYFFQDPELEPETVIFYLFRSKTETETLTKKFRSSALKFHEVKKIMFSLNFST